MEIYLDDLKQTLKMVDVLTINDEKLPVSCQVSIPAGEGSHENPEMG